MTEASENVCLVRVRAQVMCRDEGTGGWVALSGGGLAEVMVGRRARHYVTGGPANNGDVESTSACGTAPSLPYEYYIHGKRISDNSVVLECTIQKDFQYHKVMPTFHHWLTEEKRFGLTFQTAADARAFDKGVRTALEELLDVRKDDDEENNIFECLNLPTDSRSSSENSTASRIRARDDIQTPILSAITLPRHPLDSLKYESQFEDKTDEDPDRCPYVHLSAVHEYTYPQVGPGGVITSEKASPHTKTTLSKCDSGSIKKCTYSGPPPLPEKKPAEQFHARLKCRYCNEWYLESANGSGACEFGPDFCRSCIDTITCIKCAQCMVYHCIESEGEGEMVSQPCACQPTSRECATRWLGLTLLSLVVPCLWCYLPLRCAHKAARRARIAGSSHRPISK
ncbi:sprouty-related, EVH1 domain-containing protein 1 isoform X2 [Leptidea sinapis]|uniref:sprouty-related, EVH1 domain-containing protein 1 isoform X2 n=1 Tax=Leptidea sinapis TaxID=189913 RepID=UPI0021C2CAAC|nr:sprouty-related, EVH1 domain-containing protein 1 isoform X2 [Leptidea sinapis]